MKALNRAVCAILLLSLLIPVSAQFAGGTGTSLNPYQVQTPAQLDLVRNYLTAYFIQIADIDLDVSPYNAGEGWVPIGTAATPFRGNYNGDNFKIRNLFINRPATDYVGLFGNTNLATLRNITVSNADITGASYTGAVSGKTAGSVEFANCASSGTVRGVFYTGGLTGMISNRVTVTLSYSTCDVEGGTATGGLFGQVEVTSTVTNAFARGNVTGSDTVGGLIGGIAGSTVTNTFSCGAVPNGGFNGFGGLIGRILSTSTINSSYWDVETSGQTTSDGGTGKTSAEMTTQTTFVGWNFTTPIWVIDEAQNYGYPYLAWSTPEEPVSEFAGGTGTELDPYQVETAEQLNKVRDYPEAFFIQIADIDLGVAPWNENEGWIPIGDGYVPFVGSYDGGNFKISNLYINIPTYSENTGLFGFCGNPYMINELKNIVLDNADITSFKFVGGLVGYGTDYLRIINCSASGTVTGEEKVGGFIGYCENYVNISGSCSYCDVSSVYNLLNGYEAGGFVGNSYNGCSFTDCSAQGNVAATDFVGGFAGFCNGSDLTNCYSSDYIETETEYLKGGFIGWGEMNNISNCYWDTDASGLDTSYGGTPRSYIEMHDQMNYEFWDFSTPVWEINSLLNYGYPYLAWSTPPVNNTPFAGGDGSEVNPYLVATPTQLDSVRNHLTSHFRQVVDIDLSEYLLPGNPGYNDGEFWEPIGYYVGLFEGVYDGNFNTISNLKINRFNMCIGLFSETEAGSEIRNLSIYNPDSISVTGGEATGSLAGTNRGTITQCSSNCNVKAWNSAGCLAGYNAGTISMSYAAGHVTTIGDEYSGMGFGGMVGGNNGTISNCYSRGKVTGNQYVGGLCGSSYGGNIEFSYASGKVTGISDTGGLCGEENFGFESFWDIDSSYQPGTYEEGGRTHDEMLTQSNYDYIWDFTTPVWIMNPEINSGYPYLAWSDPIEPIISFEGGDGSQSNPYQIATADQLNEVRNHLDAYFIQVADIDLGTGLWGTGEGWLPIGDDSNPFTGFYDGGFYTISYLTISSSEYNWNAGLFGYVNQADLNNINLRHVLISGEIDYAGALAGSLINSSVVSNCSATGQISASNFAGGLIGCINSSCSISQCYANCDVNGRDWNFGGFAGQIWSSSVSDSYSRGTVTGTGVEGGFVGITSSSSFSNCYSTSHVTASGSTDIGGFAGSGLNCTAISVYWNIESSGQSASALGEGKTTLEMKDQVTFSGWDFISVWDIYPMNNNGYPYFQTEGLDKPPLFAGGDGSENTPYQITNVYELQNVNQFLDKYFIVMNDIEASETSDWNDGQGFEPLGPSIYYWFRGNFDGKNQIINDLYINKPDTGGVGLFGIVGENAKITGIGLEYADITGLTFTGGLAGYNHLGTIEKCFTTGSVKGIGTIGGLIGYSNNAEISDCYSRCSVEGENMIGGLIGNIEFGEINHCYSTGPVIATNSFFGGLVGYNVLGTETSSYWDIETSGMSTSDLGTGKTTAEMKTKTTFSLSGWNFLSCWEIEPATNDGYPYFMVPLEIPKNILFVANESNFNIYWDPVPEATSYKVYGSEDPYGEFSYITYNGYFHEPTKWQPFDTGYVKYFYQVVAVTGDKKDSVKPSKTLINEGKRRK